MGRKRRAMNGNKFANRAKYAALRRNVHEIPDEPPEEIIAIAPVEQPITIEPPQAPKKQVVAAVVEEDPKPKRRTRKTVAKKPTTRKRTTRKKATKKEVA